MKCENEWKTTIDNMGWFIDVEKTYKTMDINYMESVWNIFKKLYEKQLVYHGFKVLPYSTSCNTSLSNFEANMDYRLVNDPYIIISFELIDIDIELLVMTTTPWTLPSNLALCVNSNLSYIKIKNTLTEKEYIICETQISELNTNKECNYVIIEKIDIKLYIGLKYKPLYNYLSDSDCDCDCEYDGFYIIDDDYVLSNSGTGIVHLAPTYG